MVFQPQCITWPCDPIDTGGGPVPGTSGGQYPTPILIPSDPYARPPSNTGVTGGLFPPILGGSSSSTPVFSATTTELDKYRLLLLIIGIAVGYYLTKR